MKLKDQTNIIIDTDIENLYKVSHDRPSDEILEMIGRVNYSFKDLSKIINHVCPDSKERSFAFMNLEQTRFWVTQTILKYQHKLGNDNGNPTK